MYSQYMDGKFTSLEEPQPAKSANYQHTQHQERAPHRSNDLLGEITGGFSQLLGTIGKQFSAGQFDTGDILLVLIILFLFLEGDNLELVITLGLMLLLGLSDD